MIDGAPVLNGIAAVAEAAGSAVALHGVTGLAASRRGIFRKTPAAAVEEFMSARWWRTATDAGGLPGRPQPAALQDCWMKVMLASSAAAMSASACTLAANGSNE